MNGLLTVEDLSVEYHDQENTPLKAVRNVSFSVKDGRCLALIGESGSGKSTVCRACMGLLEKNAKITGGRILFDDIDITSIRTEKEWDRSGIRGKKMGMVLQDPTGSLNPIHRVGKQISESFQCSFGWSEKKAKPFVLEMLKDAGFENPEKIYRAYPQSLSGGMNQRIAIAMAVATRPKVLFCDECTSSLDVTTQASILGYLQALQKKYGITLVMITHDMGVVARMADDVAVMYGGQIVELGTCRDVLLDPRHPYTWALLSSIPQLNGSESRFVSLKAGNLDLHNVPAGDVFASRNPFTVLEIDKSVEPPMFSVSETHFAKTWLLDPRAPNVPPPSSIQNIRRMRPLWEEA